MSIERKLLKVFLCHASQDKPVVRKLYQRLQAELWIDPWLDEEKLLPGQDWDREIKKAVKAANAVIVCLSGGSVFKEGYIQKEIRFVLDIADEKPDGMIFVVPLRLNECSVPQRLASWHYIDYFPKSHQDWAYGRLLNSLTLKATTLGIYINSETDNKSQDSRLRQLLDIDFVDLASIRDKEGALNTIAEITNKTLRARFSYLTLLDQFGKINRKAYAGTAPQLIEYLNNSFDTNKLFEVSFNSIQATRVLNVSMLDMNITLDDNELQSFIAIPLRLHKLAIGSILVFGKIGSISFSEEDEFLASYIGIQACSAIEASWLYAELSKELAVASVMNELGKKFVQVEELNDILFAIANAVQKLNQSTSGGLVLYNSQGNIEASITFDHNGVNFGFNQSMELVSHAMTSKREILVSTEEQSEVCYPLQTQHRQYGALWIITPGQWESEDIKNFRALAIQGCISIEGHVLIREARDRNQLTN